MKIRDHATVENAINKALEDCPLPYLEYNNDGDIVIDGTFTLAEIKSVIAAIESVPGTSI